MWAVLFTDLVGSTAQRARVGDEAGDALRREHDALLARVLAAHRGEVVSDTGDGAMCVFSSAADAIAAGVAVQQGIERRNRRAEEALALRVGVSAGELVVEGDGLMGLAAHEAARVCALCEAGQVLISDLVRLMAGSRTDAELVERGAFELKGIPSPVTVWEVAWEATDEPDEALVLPSRLVSRDAWTFSSRDRELAALRDLWREASNGARRAVFVSGEPGIGKTRLAAEVARLACDDGALVLYGQCDDELGTPFLPFAEALDWYLEHASEVVVGRFPGDLTRLSTRVRDRLPGAPDPLSADAETEQHRLFDAVASWLCELANVQPAVLVLDDVHWGTKPTLLMLRHVLRDTDGARLLVIATYRDTDLDRAHPLGAMLGDFRRVAGVERVSLTGLDDAGVLEFLGNAAGDDVDDRIGELAGALVAETEGNPFFLGEVLQHLVESGTIVQVDGRWTSEQSIDDLGLPEGVREVVGQRLDRLGDAANALLATGALVGRDFTVAVLADVSGQGPDEVLDVLGQAVRARIVEEIALDRFRFSHALVRATLADELGSSRRLRLHRRIAEAFERVEPANVSALAHHWLEAAAAGDPARAIEYATRAAQAATEAGAFDDAVDLYRRALELCEDGDLDAQRRDLLVELAAALFRAGAPDVRETAIEAVEAARAADDARNLVRAAITLGFGSVLGDPHTVEVMTEALARAGEDMPQERARLLIGLTRVLMFEESERRVAHAEEALDLARAVDDPELFIYVGETYLHAMSNPDNLERRIAIALEIQEIGEQVDNAFARYQALPLQPAWEAGRLDLITRNAVKEEALLELVPHAGGRRAMFLHRAKNALFTGRLADAERALEDLITKYGDLVGVFPVYATPFAYLRCEQGRAGEIVELVKQVRDQLEGGGGVEPAIRSFEAFTALQAGDRDHAAALLRTEAGARFAAQPRDGAWYAYHANWAELAAEVGDTDAAEQLHGLLLPFVDRLANFIPVALGSVARHVGRLETILGAYSEAEEHLAYAAARHEEWGAALYLARTWADQAELILVRGGDDAVPEAKTLLNRTRAVARERDALGVEQYADRVVERARDRGIAL